MSGGSLSVREVTSAAVLLENVSISGRLATWAGRILGIDHRPSAGVFLTLIIAQCLRGSHRTRSLAPNNPGAFTAAAAVIFMFGFSPAGLLGLTFLYAAVELVSFNRPLPPFRRPQHGFSILCVDGSSISLPRDLSLC